MTGLICLVIIAYTLAVAILVYVNWAQGRELAEVRAQNERLIARIGSEYGFTTTKPVTFAPPHPQPPIGPVPQPMWSFKKGRS